MREVENDASASAQSRRTGIVLTKESIAVRQIDAAIKWLFMDDDRVATYTVVAAAVGILRDLLEVRKPGCLQDFYKNVMIRGLQAVVEGANIQLDLYPFRSFLGQLNQASNFLKHADRDSGKGLDQGEIDVEAKIAEAVLLYEMLGLKLTRRIDVFITWYKSSYPRPENRIKMHGGYFDELERATRLTIGRELLSGTE